ncbi:RNA polymerase sigma-70 factor [Rudanella paleaurantiibacter]|uniref:RNA polymerase sigma-70 factor n=1 Tax=Rudanella paleaurantiibacter TaxID=2614655 RepID=A0A7J5U5N9_9BACT|nr:RNA polymerase sigma-70 factor [Rudanella paleaurantiibacter]KAB7733158.1 RNA polymerase sigma-70 factor [Rudanella paleaurantiibacter]
MSTRKPASTYSQWDNGQLLTALTNHDRLALAELYERYWYGLYRVALQKTNSHEVAEELVQDLFVDLWQGRATLAVQQVEAYLFTALRYAVVDHIRRQVQRERFQLYQQQQMGQADTATEELLNYQDLIALIEDELQKMPEKTGQIFRLSRYEDQSIPSIAQSLDLSEKAVEYHLNKALKTLRQNLTMLHYPLPLLGYLLREWS